MALDTPPLVNFNMPPNGFQLLAAEQRRLIQIALDMKAVMRAAIGYSEEGKYYANIALFWAGGLIALDATRGAMNVFVPHAGQVFAVWDRSVAKAQRIMSDLTSYKPVTKDDLFAATSPEYRNTQDFIRSIEDGRKILTQLGVKAPRLVDRILDTGVDLTKDVTLALSANDTRNRIDAMSGHAQVQMAGHLAKVEHRIRAVGIEMARLLEQCVRFSRIA